MQTGNAVVLALILGAMIAFDMGGPVNKSAFFFGAAIPRRASTAMGAAPRRSARRRSAWAQTLLDRKQGIRTSRGRPGRARHGHDRHHRGRDPRGRDPLRHPGHQLGLMPAVIAMPGGVGDHAPHGGPIVLPVVDNRPLSSPSWPGCCDRPDGQHAQEAGPEVRRGRVPA
jgi:fructose-specific PTS system IIC-like component